MDVETEVKPWISLEEWKKVKNCLKQRKLKLAQEYINVWKIRTHKLDAGKSISKTVNFCKSFSGKRERNLWEHNICRMYLSVYF